MSESKQSLEDDLIGSTWVNKVNANLFIQVTSIRMSINETTVYYKIEPLNKIHQLDMHQFLEQFRRTDNAKCPSTFFGIDWACDDSVDHSVVQYLKINTVSHHYYVTYDFNRGGKRGYSKGSIYMCFDSISEFSVFDAEKIIKRALKKKRVRHKAVIVNNWIGISKDQFNRMFS